MRPVRWMPRMPFKKMPDQVLLDQFGGPIKLGQHTPGLAAERVVTIPFSAVGETNLTVEQLTIQEAGHTLAKLLKDKAFKAVMESMIAFRRAYAVAYRELEEIVVKHEEAAVKNGEKFSPDVKDFAIQYAMYEAGKAFSEHTLMQGVIDYVLPWMVSVVDRHTEEDENAHVAEKHQEAMARADRAIPIGFDHTPGQDVSGVVTRDRSVVFVGWRPAVRWLLSKVEEAAAKEFMTVRFYGRQVDNKDIHNLLVRVASRDWYQCAESNNALARVMGKRVADKLSRPVELLICDELVYAYTARPGAAILPKPPGVHAGEAHKVFRRWCNGAKAAFVGGVGSDNATSWRPDDPEWEQLRTFTYLRPVTVQVDSSPESTGQYVLTVGNQAARFKVDRGELDCYATTEILT